MLLEKRRFRRNVVVAILSQLISTFAGVLVSFIVPRFLGVEQFGYWQLFLLYVAYVNILSFGIFDGIYLRHGGEEYEDLDHDLLGTEWRLYLVFQFLFAALLVLIVLFSGLSFDRKLVLICCCVCIPVINSNDFFGRLLQAVNKTTSFSISVILFNLLWFVAVGFVVFGKVYTYKIIIIMYLLGQVFAGLFLGYKSRSIIFAKHVKLTAVFADIKANIKVGVCLFVAGYASSLIIGSAKFIVDNSFGIEVFSKVSFSLSLTTFFLKFINQVSMVLFPALRRLNADDAKTLFVEVDSALDVILPAILLMYLPIKYLVSWWLPQYTESLSFLLFLLPICIFDGKMQLLYDTFFKVLKKQKMMLIINLSTMFFSIVLTLLIVLLKGNLTIIVCGILLSITLRSFVASRYFGKRFEINLGGFLGNLAFVILFIVLGIFLDGLPILIAGIGLYCVYLIINSEKVKKLTKQLFSVLKR